MNNILRAGILAITVGGLGACAGNPAVPRELIDARQAYQRAAEGPAAAYAASELALARQSLSVAERSFKDDGDNTKTRDLAYVADRRARAAAARAEAIDLQAKQSEAQAELAQWQQRLEISREKERASRVESERQARVAAVQQQRSALDDLAGVEVGNEGDALLVSITGNLFAPGRDTLTAAGKLRLADVAGILREQNQSLTVRGHTDATGDEDRNMELSQRRAETVRRFLEERGVARGRIQVEGLGASRPIAGNDTAEGRMQNRRIELLLAP